MEPRKNTTAGVLFWTPAPVGTSPTSSVASEDEGGEETERGDDFVSQMDENGIIGLSEALGEVELEPPGSDSNVYAGPATLQEAEPRERDRDTPEDRSYNASHNESQGGDVRIPSSCESLSSFSLTEMLLCKISRPGSSFDTFKESYQWSFLVNKTIETNSFD